MDTKAASTAPPGAIPASQRLIPEKERPGQEPARRIPPFLESSGAGAAPRTGGNRSLRAPQSHPVGRVPPPRCHPRVPGGSHSPARCPAGRGCPPSPSPGSAAGSVPAHPRSLRRQDGIRGQQVPPTPAPGMPGWNNTGMLQLSRDRAAQERPRPLPQAQPGFPGIPREPGAHSSQSLIWRWERPWSSSSGPAPARTSFPVMPARTAPPNPQGAAVPCSSSPCRPLPKQSCPGICFRLPDSSCFPGALWSAGSTPNPHLPPSPHRSRP